MKRMVENSEKIEKLLENVNVGDEILFKNDVIFNGKLITTNLTTNNNDQIYIFKSTDYSINNEFPGTVDLINLGTALLVKATINSGTPNDLYNIITIYKDLSLGFAYFKMSNGLELNVSIEEDVGKFNMQADFNETLADHTRSEYSLIFIIGHNGIQQ